jgi:putative endonuclease
LSRPTAGHATLFSIPGTLCVYLRVLIPDSNSSARILELMHFAVALMERAVLLLERCHVKFGSAPQRTAVQRRGIEGERVAYFHLRRAGYVVVARRWRHALADGEVDLIGWDGEVLCFVEVKTRSIRTQYAAEFHVNAKKQKTLRRMAKLYVRQLPWRPGQERSLAPRFDIVSVYMDGKAPADVRLLRNAF